MIVITLTAGSRSYIERIPENQTRINIDPQYYREVRFLLDSRETLDKHRDHFVYNYLETLYREGDLPGFLAKAPSVEVVVSRESEQG